MPQHGKKQQEKENRPIDRAEFSKKVINIIDFIKSPDISEKAKNEALRTIIRKIIYVKPENRIDIVFHS